MNQNRKWTDGRMLQGAYRQWLVDEHPEALKYVLIDIVARYTFGFGKRYGYIPSATFEKYLPSITRKRHMVKLRELGLLDYHRTREYTMYRLSLPQWLEESFNWKRKQEEVEPHATGSVETVNNIWMEAFNEGNH